jgi:hypothetical protein
MDSLVSFPEIITAARVTPTFLAIDGAIGVPMLASRLET